MFTYRLRFRFCCGCVTEDVAMVTAVVVVVVTVVGDGEVRFVDFVDVESEHLS